MTPRTTLPLSLVLAILVSQAVPAKGAPLAGDPDHGRIVFQQNCAVCHATGQDMQGASGQGPVLGGVLGRPAASVPYFGYTKALRASQLTWDQVTLDRFIAGPQALVPGTAMVVVVPSAADRTDLVAFLSTLPKVEPSVLAALSASGQKSAGDWMNDAPGKIHRVNIDLLPAPFASHSAQNGPSTVDRPEKAVLSVPPGFTVKPFTTAVKGPRLIRTAPNGDLFIAEMNSGDIRVLRAADGAEEPSENRVFASGLEGPFGIAFYPAGPDPKWVYIGVLNAVVRFPYENGDLEARGPAETVVARLTKGSTGGHTTRDLAFSRDGRRLFIAVGSGSNVAEGLKPRSPDQIWEWEESRGTGAIWGAEANRANILVTDPTGREPLRPFATGIRNPVGLAVNPTTGDLWMSTNERDGLGDDLVPDYISRVKENAFYGWPWYYMGDHEDPRHAGERPDLKGVMTNPDVPLQAHSASLQITYYTATSGSAAFPSEYQGSLFAAEHGSWNRSTRTGSKVIRIVLKDGVPTGEYEDFLTGFVVDDHHVWGRPVGVTVAHDGALIVTEDANSTVWRVAYVGAAKAP